MKIFVASWFYVPVTTSEALVTYKLLANSENEYVVCSARSNKWSYKKDSELKSDNITQYIIETDDFNEYVEKAVELYKELIKTQKFDAIMTRSLPPESQLVGFKIKEIDKEVPWIASLADPIGNNPYETTFFFLNNRHKIIRKLYSNAPHMFMEKICPLVKKPAFIKMSQLYRLEKKVLEKADVIITPTEAQAKYIMHKEEIYNKKSLVVPHSYDKRLYKEAPAIKNEKFTFTFIGQSDAYRSIEPVIRAMKLIKDINPQLFNKIKIRLIGNIPSEMKDMVYVYFLQDSISIEGSCDYFESLKIMQESDCLIHVDAWFDMLQHGSIFFAAKIADYLGARRPILGITDPQCPAGQIITACGGMCCKIDPADVAKAMIKIMDGNITVNEEQAEKFSSVNVGKEYDEAIKRRLFKDGK